MSPPRRRLAAFSGALLCAGLIFRVSLSLRTPVGYDEVFVMGVGTDAMLASVRAFFIEAPLRRSDAITPLWWWVQAVPALLLGRISLVGFRLVPLLLGGLTLVVGYAAARRRFGRGPARLFLGFAALSDVLAFTNARGEFAESLLLLWVVPWMCWVGDRRRPLSKGLLGGLILMTHLGKGALLVAALTFADVVAQFVRYRKPAAAVRPMVSLCIAVAPTALWLLFATAAMDGAPLVTDIGPVAHPWEALWKLTAGYGETKGHMVSAALDAAHVWLDGWIWPITAITALPLLIGSLAALRFRGRRGACAAGLLAWVVVGVVAVVGRGVVGARFHLLYLPALWLAAAVGLWRFRAAPRGHRLGFGIAWAVSAWAAFSWADWGERVWEPATFGLLPAAACMAGVGGFDRAVRRGWVLVPATFLCVTGLLAVLALRGPQRWAPFVRMEPFAGRSELADIDAHRSDGRPLPEPHGRTLYIDLANYFLTKRPRTDDDLARAEYYAVQETRRVPRDPRAWFYLGEALNQRGVSPERARAAWEESYRLKPTRMLEERLRGLSPSRRVPSPRRDKRTEG